MSNNHGFGEQHSLSHGYCNHPHMTEDKAIQLILRCLLRQMEAEGGPAFKAILSETRRPLSRTITAQCIYPDLFAGRVRMSGTPID
jgi:hypothetical protein